MNKYNGDITNLSTLSYNSSNLRGGQVGNYAIFGAGYTTASSNNTTSVVECYNNNLVKSNCPSLSYNLILCGEAYNDNYFLFAGGYSYTYGSGDAGVINNVTAYSTNLTKSSPSYLTNRKLSMSCSRIDQYILLAGGWNAYITNAKYTDVECYNNTLTKSSISPIGTFRQQLSNYAFSDNYALFAGGNLDNSSLSGAARYSDIVDTYNSSLTKGLASNLSTSRVLIAGGCVDNKILLAGGSRNVSDSSASYDIVECYDSTLTKSILTSLTNNETVGGCVNLDDFVVFAGGIGYGTGPFKTVDVYNRSLTKSTSQDLSNTKASLLFGRAGNYAIFAGGNGSNGNKYQDVEAYIGFYES